MDKKEIKQRHPIKVYKIILMTIIGSTNLSFKLYCYDRSLFLIYLKFSKSEPNIEVQNQKKENENLDWKEN